MFREAGADRYMLRHETADPEHYRKFHPAEMELEARKQCLYDLKDLGYQVGAGFMVGFPGQTFAALAKDLDFLKKLEPQMVGIGPFIPHHETQFAQERAGSVVMPNLSPVRNRKQYELYDNKICTGEEAAEYRGCLARRVGSVGCRLVNERGDAVR